VKGAMETGQRRGQSQLLIYHRVETWTFVFLFSAILPSFAVLPIRDTLGSVRAFFSFAWLARSDWDVQIDPDKDKECLDPGFVSNDCARFGPICIIILPVIMTR
jgi:hypothetical protein